jgi:hypothetical protein
MEETSEDQNNKALTIDERIELEVNAFVKDYFDDLKAYLDHHKAWLKKHNIKKLNSADYFNIRRFLYTAINNLLEIDRKIRAGVLDALMEDVDLLYKYYDQVYQATLRNIIVMENDFLPRFDMYMKVKKELDDNMKRKLLYESQEKRSKATIEELDQLPELTDEQDAIYKTAKRQNADAVHHSAEAREVVARAYEQEKVLKHKISTIFDGIFEKAKKEVIGNIIEVINIKSFCLDQALWYYAENSIPVKRFFEVSQIKGDFSLRTYIDYYVKNLDTESSNSKEVKLLLKAMKELDQQ